ASARNHRSLRYAPMPQKRSLDLPKLNAKSANLNLMVRATHKLQNSIPAPARQVPAAVHPTPRSPKPIRNKTLRCQTTTTQIPPPNPPTQKLNPPKPPKQAQAQNNYQKRPRRNWAADDLSGSACRLAPLRPQTRLHRSSPPSVHKDW